MLHRLVEELRARHDAAAVARALAALRFADGTITRDEGIPLDAAPPVATVAIAPGVYARTPTHAGRSALLAAAARLAPEVRVHVPITSASRIARLFVDGPRRLLRTSAEPGDRFAGTFLHASFDDEELLREAADAGLVAARREGSWVVLAPGTLAEDAASFLAELRRAALVLPGAERLRHGSPRDAVATMRRRGARAGTRGPIGRARLRRAIGWLDALHRPNCFRRVLAEIALDAGAARETLVFGLDVGRTGHVAFAGSEDLTFDVAIAIPPG